MCGIAGFLRWPFDSADAANACAEAMALALAHRGPDDSAIWASPDGDVRFAHRRLAVIDLTATGRQPMTSADGRWTICFNGEIYNYEDLRARLVGEGVQLRGRSDTETLIESIARYGLTAALQASEGMFAFALWDGRDKRLFLVRDRVGVKPLYWMRAGSGFGFASELKALRVLPGAAFSIDTAALGAFFRFGYVPAPACIFEKVYKVEPAAILSISASGEISTQTYWSAWEAAQAPLDTRSDEDLIDALDVVVRRAVKQELIADVPVGCFLSGGVDSSLVAALAQKATSGRLETFSVGFDDPSIDESAHAQAVSEHIGSRHHALHVDAAAASAVIPLLPEMYDEPLADMAQIPTYLVSKLARERVTVALSGDGGDELFAGYDRYATAESVCRKLSAAPPGMMRLAGGALRLAPEPLMSAIAAIAQPGMGRGRARARIDRLVAALGDVSPLNVYRATTSLWLDQAEVLTNHGIFEAPAWRRTPAENVIRAFQLIDLHTYLPDDVLAKVDRASMAVSLEARVPLLNHRLAEFALALPERVTRREGRGKWLLRQVLFRHVPRALIDRPKQGFSVPMGEWLRGPLKAWASGLLNESALAESGLLKPAPIVKKWRQHLEGSVDWSFALWAVLTFEAWRKQWRYDANTAA